MMGKSSKKKRWLGCVIAALVILFGVWYWLISDLFADMSDRPYKYMDTDTSSNAAYTITVWRSDGIWSFGPARAKVVAISENDEKVYETEIHDDGGNGDVDIQWLDDVTACVILCGKEQKNEIITVCFSDKIHLTTSLERSKEAEENL